MSECGVRERKLKLVGTLVSGVFAKVRYFKALIIYVRIFRGGGGNLFSFHTISIFLKVSKITITLRARS